MLSRFIHLKSGTVWLFVFVRVYTCVCICYMVVLFCFVFFWCGCCFVLCYLSSFDECVCLFFSSPYISFFHSHIITLDLFTLR